jgi:hypothetical protein
MRTILLAVTFLLCGTGAYAQKLKKYAIGASGCSAYFMCNPGNFTVDRSPDSSEIYTAECKDGEAAYGIICVKLNQPVSTMEEAEEMLIAYLDYLKPTLNITNAAGYGKGHKLRNSEDTKGVIDYWKDKAGDEWKIKGWTNKSYLAVLYVAGKKEVPISKANVFLDGFLFPGM